MSSEVTKRMIAEYVEDAPKPAALTSLFQSPPENFHSSEEVEIDVTRGGEDVAIVVQDLSVGSRSNSADLYTNKSFRPPIYSESFAVNSFDLIKRMSGSDPFMDANFQLNASKRFMDGMRKVNNKIIRAIELQASQVLTTGKLTLGDSAGVELYALDYKPKATHFPTASTAWNASGATILSDINGLCNVIRNDGKKVATDMILGEGSFEAMVQDDDVKARLDNRRIEMGSIGMIEKVASGLNYRGVIEVGNYSLRVWSYPGVYTHPQTGASTQYVDDGKAIIYAEDGRLDATFGAIPRIVPVENRVLPYLPETVTMPGRGMTMSTFAWVTPNGSQLMGEVGSRPLLIPTAIDTFGCIATGV